MAHVGDVLHEVLRRVAFDGPHVGAHGLVFDLLQCVPADAVAVFERVFVELDARDGQSQQSAGLVAEQHGAVVAASPAAQWSAVRIPFVGIVEPVHCLFDHVTGFHAVFLVFDPSACDVTS